MKELTQGTILYHGSYCVVEAPDLSRCAKYKDLDRDFISRPRNVRQRVLQKLQLRKLRMTASSHKMQLVAIYPAFE